MLPGKTIYGGFLNFDMEKAQRVFDAAMRGGSHLSGKVLAAAIRKALMESTDDSGKLNVSELYDLTCKLERISL